MASGESSQCVRVPPPRPTPPAKILYKSFQKLYRTSLQLANEGIVFDELGNANDAINMYTMCLEHIELSFNIELDEQYLSTDERTYYRDMTHKLTKTKMQVESRLDMLYVNNTPTHCDPNMSPPSYEDVIAGGAHICYSDPQQKCHVSETNSRKNISSEGKLEKCDSSEKQGTSENKLEKRDNSENKLEKQGSSDNKLEKQSSSEKYQNLGKRPVCVGRRVSQNATRVFFIPEGVQLLYISPEGYVTTPSSSYSLNIYHMNEDLSSNANTKSTPPAFLQVAEWLYPLIPGVSPVLHSSYGAYIFPDLLAPREGSSVGLILPKSLSVEERQQFEELLSSLTQLERQPRAERPQVLDLEDKVTVQEEVDENKARTLVARSIERAADIIAWSLGKGAEQGTALMKKGSSTIMSHITPAAHKTVHPTAQKSTEYLRSATHTAVSVSDYVLTKLTNATLAFGREVAPHIIETGKKIIPKSVQEHPESSSRLETVLEIASSSIKGVGTVFVGLDLASKHLARGLIDQTVEVINYKYGTEVAKATENTLYSVANVSTAATNVSMIQNPKNFAKRTLRERCLQDHSPSTSTPKATDLYKDENIDAFSAESMVPSTSFTRLQDNDTKSISPPTPNQPKM
ncbi:spartin-like [Argonauta hians]